MNKFLLCDNIFYITSFFINATFENKKLTNNYKINYIWANGDLSNYDMYDSIKKFDNNIILNLPDETEEITISKLYICDINTFYEYFSNLPITINLITIYDLTIYFFSSSYSYNKTELKEIYDNIETFLFKRIPLGCKVRINKKYIKYDNITFGN